MTTRNLPTATPLLFVGFALDRDDFVLRRAQPGEPHNVEAFVRSEHALRQHIANGGWFRHRSLLSGPTSKSERYGGQD
jgi:hypothetical protein